MAKRKKLPALEHAILGLNVTAHSVHIDSAINYEINDKRFRNDDTEVYAFRSYIDIDGVVNYPDNKAGEKYKITVNGYETEPGLFKSKLSDYRVRDGDGALKLQKVRGQEIVLFDPPKSIGYLCRQYRSKDWYGAVWIAPRMVSDMLALLPHVRPIYIQLHVLSEGKYRRVRGLTLQTTDPAEE